MEQVTYCELRTCYLSTNIRIVLQHIPKFNRRIKYLVNWLHARAANVAKAIIYLTHYVPSLILPLSHLTKDWRPSWRSDALRMRSTLSPFILLTNSTFGSRMWKGYFPIINLLHWTSCLLHSCPLEKLSRVTDDRSQNL